MTVALRNTEATDLRALRALYRAAFPDEDLVGLVAQLTGDASQALSLVASGGTGAILGHLHVTRCAVGASALPIFMVGPLAVLPEKQGRGIGTWLVEAGCQRLAETAPALVLVLGDPAYYGRFGFQPETAVRPPYDLPPAWAEAWQGLSLGKVDRLPVGMLAVPLPWQDKDLWLPAAGQT